MKKKLAAIALMLCALIGLSACSSRTLVSVDPNWQTNTTTPYQNDFYERTVYNVSFEADEDATNGMIYREFSGTYEVVVKAIGSYPQPENNFTVSETYKLTSTLTVSATIAKKGSEETLVSFGGDSGNPEDKIVTTVWFRSAGARLQPIRTEVDLYTHTPNANQTVTVYSYASVTAYNEGCSRAQVTVTDRSEEITEEETDALSIGQVRSGGSYSDLQDDYSCFDNAQLYFAGRGFTFDKNTSHTVTVLDDTVGKRNVNYSCSEVVTVDNLNFTLNGISQNGTEITVSNVNISLSGAGNNTGPLRTIQYIRTRNETNNTYHNLPVRIEEFLSYYMGSYVFTLRSASVN